MNTSEIVIEILKDLSGKAEINQKDRLQEDIGLDSLCMVALLVEIEEKFQIELDESDMNPYDLQTVQDVVELATKYRGDIHE